MKGGVYRMLTFILGFGYRKETDSQNKNNDTINTDTDKEKT